MVTRLSVALFAGLLVTASVTPVAAKTVTVPFYWVVNKGDLSIARMRAALGPRLRNYVCNSYRKGQHPGNVLKTGGSVRMVFYGFSDVITTFTYTRRDCG